jgi:glycosyltransferase involved in cell wall biosynthesis
MPKFSIIVPTKNRSKYLHYTLKSIVEQNFNDFEIVVSDNFSQDETKEIVDKFKDPRIKYFRTNSELNRTDSWNFGLSKSKGEYVTFIGDDDSFLPNSLGLLDNMLVKYNTDVITWRQLNYSWPDHLYDEKKNLINGQSKFLYAKINSKARFKMFYNFYERYNSLPCIYNSLVHIKYIKKIESISKNNNFFGGIIPDVYSGIVLSRVIQKYLYTYFPFTINGASALSGGVAQGTQKKINKELLDQVKDISIANLEKKYDERIGYSPSVYSIELGEYLLASKNLQTLHWPKPNWRNYISALMRDAKSSENQDEVYKAAKFTIKKNGMKFIYLPKLKKVDKKNNSYLDCKIHVSHKYVKNSYDASNFLKLLPEIDDVGENTSLKIIKKWLNESKLSFIELIRLFFSK